MAANIKSKPQSGRVKSLSIKTAGIIFVAVLALAALANIATVYTVEQEMMTVGRAWDDYDSRDDIKSEIVIEIREDLGYGGMIHQLKNYIIHGDAQSIAAVRSNLIEAKIHLAEYAATGTNENQARALDDIERTINLYEKATDEAEHLTARGVAARDIDKAIEIDDRAALEALEELEAEYLSAHAVDKQRMYESLEHAIRILTDVKVVTVALSAAMMLFFIWYLINRVTRPVTELSAAMKSLAKGDLEVCIPALDRRDEIGEMAAAMEVFQDTAISRLWAEEALRVGEGRLKLFIEHTPVAIAMFDADMCYMMCSRLWLDEYGLADTEIIGRSHYEMRPDTPEERKEIFRNGLSGVSQISEEDLIHHSDTGTTWTRWFVEPWMKGDGEIGGIIVISEDITERKQAEEALRDSERRLVTTQQIAKLGHWEWDMASDKMFMSREIAVVIGEQEGDIDISYADYQKRIHPYDRDYVNGVLQTFRETHEPYDIEYRVISKSGDIRVLHEKGEYQPGVDGNSDKAFGMIQDISDLSRAQESARESEEHIRLVVENVADGVITIDESGIVESFFGAAENIFGYTGEEVIGENIAMLMPEPFHSAHAGYLEAYVKGRGTGLVGGTGREVTGRRKDGTMIPLDLMIGELHQRGKRKFVGTVRDISEKKLIEQRMRDSNRLEAIGELAGGVAHDFNNILMVINGFAKRAVANMDNNERLQESLGEVIKSADKGATLTHQLLMFGRRELLESRVFRVSDQIRDYIPLLETLVSETITLNVEIEDERACIETDPGELYQAVVNLAVNGRDAMPDGGTLTIRLHMVEFDEMRALLTPNATVGEYVCLSVADDGSGMDGDTVSRVFEPFFTTKEQGKGTGLGLALVYGFIKQSGGVIEVDSSPGEGTEFSLYFKAVDREPVVQAERSVEAHTSNNETILLAEDDDALRRLAQEILEEHGYKVLAARDGVEALETEDEYEGTIHMLITDVVMPGLSGFDVAEVLRQSRPEAKVVFMSGYPARGQIQAVDIPNDAPFLQKPFLPEKLAEMVRETLAAAPAANSDSQIAASGD